MAPRDLTEFETKVVALWVENHSQREISIELGVSLGVISGAVFRLKTRGVIEPKTREQVAKVCSRAAVASRPQKPKMTQKKKPAPPVVAEDAAPPPPVVADGDLHGIGIMSLTRKTCRWVLPHRGSDGMALFCGEAVHHRQFCRGHAARAFHMPHDWKPSTPNYNRLRALLVTTSR
jgi:hypothetical protein